MFLEQSSSNANQYRSSTDRSRYFANVDFDGRGLKIPGSFLSERKMIYFLDRVTLPTSSPVDFDLLPRRFRAVTADLETGERVVLGNGSMADAMRASLSIPGIFAPYNIGGRFLVDGGTVDNLPVGTARALGADFVIAVDLRGGTPFTYESIERNPVSVVSRSMDIMIRSNVEPQLLDADLVLSVDLSGYQVSDFQKAAEIIACGEMTARKAFHEIEAFKEKLGPLAPGAAIPKHAETHAIARVIVEGGTEKMRSHVAASFSPVVGTIPDDDLIKQSIESLDLEGIYEEIRVKRVGDESAPTLQVTLSRREKPGHTVQLGIGYAATYSDSTTSVSGLSAGVVFRGVTSDDSRLAFSVMMLDSPAFEASFIQPISAFLFVESLFKASKETSVHRSESTISYLYQTKALEVELNLGFQPAEWAEISTGFGYEWIQHDQLPDLPSGEIIGSTPMAHVLFSLRQFDSPVFPLDGLSIQLRYDQSIADAGSGRSFRTIETEGQIIRQLGLPLSLTAWWKAGSDFSLTGDSDSAAPLYHKPDLANRQFFPGPLELNERLGSHVAGIGTEIKFQLNKASSTVSFPSFFLLQAAAGTAMQDATDINQFSGFINLNTALGIGVRINDGFGASLRFGVTRGFQNEYKLFASLDLGSFGY